MVVNNQEIMMSLKSESQGKECQPFSLSDLNSKMTVEDADVIKQLQNYLSTGFADLDIASDKAKLLLLLVNKLKFSFARLTKIPRQKCLTHLISVIINSGTNEKDFATACVMLSILELSCLRNSDHLNNDVSEFETHCQSLFFNLPFTSDSSEISDLKKWSYDVLLICFRQVYFWFIHLGFSSEKLPLTDFKFFSSNVTNFILLKTIYKHQSSGKHFQPHCLLNSKLDFLDVLLLSLKVIDFEDVESVIVNPKRLKLDSDACWLEFSDLSPELKGLSKIKSVLNSDETHNKSGSESLIELQAMLNNPDAAICVKSIEKILQLKNHHALRTNKEESLRIIANALKKSHQIVSICLKKNAGSYEKTICNLLRLWNFMTETKYLLKYLPQSYLYVAPFISLSYQDMTLNGFIECLSLQASFLVKYIDCFRSSIVTSPHWYIDMLVSMISAIVTRCHSGNEYSTFVTDSICLAIADIGRASQQIFNSDLKNRMSRCTKVPLEAFVCVVSETMKPLPNIVKQTLIESCVYYWLECIDNFTLEQIVLSLKPGPREILKRLVSQFNKNYKHSGSK